MDIAMLQFLQLHWFSTTENVRFSFFFQINIMQLDASANFFFVVLTFTGVGNLSFHLFFFAMLSCAPQAFYVPQFV